MPILVSVRYLSRGRYPSRKRRSPRPSRSLMTASSWTGLQNMKAVSCSTRTSCGCSSRSSSVGGRVAHNWNHGHVSHTTNEQRKPIYSNYIYNFSFSGVIPHWECANVKRRTSSFPSSISRSAQGRVPLGCLAMAMVQAGILHCGRQASSATPQIWIENKHPPLLFQQTTFPFCNLNKNLFKMKELVQALRGTVPV